MAAADQELLVRIAADTRSLRRELDRAASASRQTSDRMRRDFDRAGDKLTGLSVVANKAKAAFGGLLAGFTAGALVQSIGRITSEMDRLVNTADRLGVTVEMLQELRFAAAEVGVEANTLDMALQRFIRRLGEAQAGGGELKDTLSQYGIALRDANGRTRNADAVLTDLADAIKGAGSEQERLRIAFKAFDSEGAALVTLLKQGGEGLDAFREKARSLGVVVKNETARDLAEARREMERFADVLSTRLTIGIGTALRDLRRLSAALSGEDLPATEGELSRQLAGVNEMLEANAAVTAKVQAMRAGNLLEQGAAFVGLPSPEQLREDREALLLQRQNLQRQLQFLQEMAKLDAAATAAAGGGSAPAAALKGSIPKTGQGVNSLTTGKADDATRLFFAKYATEHTEGVRAAREQAAKFNEIIGAQTRAVGKADTALSGYGESARDVAGGLQNAGVSGLRSFENALIGVASGTATAADAFRSMTASILADLARIAIQKNITGPLADVLDGLFSDTYAGNPNGVRPGSFNPRTETAGRAAGGGVRAGTPYLVGERRPEIFVPESAGRIVPNARGAGGGGGIGKVVVVDQRGAGAPPARVQRERGPDGMQIVRVMVRDAVRDGVASGQFDRVLGDSFGLRRSGSAAT